MIKKILIANTISVSLFLLVAFPALAQYKWADMGPFSSENACITNRNNWIKRNPGHKNVAHCRKVGGGKSSSSSSSGSSNVQIMNMMQTLGTMLAPKQDDGAAQAAAEAQRRKRIEAERRRKAAIQRKKREEALKRHLEMEDDAIDIGDDSDDFIDLGAGDDEDDDFIGIDDPDLTKSHKKVIVPGFKDQPKQEFKESEKPRINRIRGDVKVCRMTGKECVWEKVTPGTKLGPGDQIKTGKDSAVEIAMTDKSLVEVQPNTIYTITAPAEGFIQKGKLFLGNLKQKAKRLVERRRRPMRITSDTAVAAVRATEFSLETNGNKSLTHLRLYEGTLGFSAVDNNVNKKTLKRWWADKLPSKTTAPKGSLAKLHSVSGQVGLKKNQAKWASASAGTSLSSGDQINVGNTGYAQVALLDGSIIILDKNSKLEILGDDDAALATAKLRKGRMFAKSKQASDAKKKPVLFSAGITNIVAADSEFEVSVDANKVAEVTAISGAMAVMSDDSDLDRSKLDKFWHK
ncbi:FecR domain-containing protein [Elusimicrobiota bacterium]